MKILLVAVDTYSPRNPSVIWGWVNYELTNVVSILMPLDDLETL